jgi:hypothetical protein
VIGVTKVTGETLMPKAIFAAEGKARPPPMSSESQSDKICISREGDKKKEAGTTSFWISKRE